MIPIYHYTTKHMLSPKLSGWESNILDVHPGRFLSLKS
jgi:oligopeptide transport system substrate-binding protein